MTLMLLCSITVSIQLYLSISFFGKQTGMTFSLAVNSSWYEAKNVCASHNATLLILASHNDIYAVQTFMIDIANHELPLPIFLGLKRDVRVRIFSN